MTTLTYTIRPMTPEDREAVISILNHYIVHSFAAYPEEPLPLEFFDMFLHLSQGYPTGVICDKTGTVVGFGMLRAHSPLPTLAHTAEVSSFILPAHTGKGLGKMLLATLEEGARARGITTLLANISSLNPGSIAFHRRNGFRECGRFLNVGRKNGQEFDTVWMQKML